MYFDEEEVIATKGRTSHEVRGLKLFEIINELNKIGRTSHEVRGLKFLFWEQKILYIAVAPHTRCVD